MFCKLAQKTLFPLSYPNILTTIHGIVLLKTFVYILYIFEFMQGKTGKTCAQLELKLIECKIMCNIVCRLHYLARDGDE